MTQTIAERIGIQNAATKHAARALRFIDQQRTRAEILEQYTAARDLLLTIDEWFAGAEGQLQREQLASIERRIVEFS